MKMCWIVLTLVFSVIHAKPLDLVTKAKSVILINADSGAILYEKNAHSPVYPASITKIATALFVLEEQVDLSRVVKVNADCIRLKPPKKDWSQVSAYWLEADGTKMGLIKDEEISIESLLHGLMLSSANDAANVLAMEVSGSIPTFTQKLNDYLRSVGCQNTHFINPHGLHHPEHMTTAFDMSLIAKKAMHNNTFREIVAKVHYLKPATNKHDQEEIRQHNHLLLPGRFYYPKAIGVKTGYTSQAQNNLVAAAQHDGRTLIAVILGCEKRPDRYADATALFDAAFAEQRTKRIFFSGSECYSHSIKGAKHDLEAVLAHELAIDFYPAEEPERLHAQIYWMIPRFPIQKGAKVGEIRVMDGNDSLQKSVDLLAKEDVKSTLLFDLQNGWHRLFH